jgi:hypothetical protein
MTAATNRFFNSIQDAQAMPTTQLVGYFAYFLTVESDEAVATTAAIDECFRECDLTPLKNTSAYLSKSLKGKSAKFVKVAGGYRLQRAYRDELAKTLGASTSVIQTSAELRKLETKLPSGAEKGFLKELEHFQGERNRVGIPFRGNV